MSAVELEGLSLWDRLRACWRHKVAVWLGLAVGICVPYFTLQAVPLFPVRGVPETPLDRWIPFEPGFIWLYVSLALLVPLAPALATRRRDLARYAKGLAWLCVPCFLIFALLPVAGPRPELAPDHALYAWIVSVDRPTNSMPSLHAGLAVYSLLYGLRVLRGDQAPGRLAKVTGAAYAWVGLILYSTLATKQHWLVDVPAGALLAFGAHAFVWRSAAERQHQDQQAHAGR